MKKKTGIKALVGALVLCSGIVFANIPAKADNPIIQNNYTADPAPMAYGDTLYLYTSHDEDETYENFYTMNDWKCYSTKDMVNWTDHGTIMDFKSFSWVSDKKVPRAWAPQCVERNGKFYLYVPIRGKGMDIGVGVSDSPTGPFVDAIGKPLVSNGSWDNIDPTVFVDDDGQAYLYFGNPKLMYVKLNEDMISYDESEGIVDVEMTEEAFGESPDKGHKTSYGEGPWFYKRNNLYYMVYAAFKKGQSEHLAYSTSESPTGPWTYGGVIMPSQQFGNTGVSYTNHPGVVDFQGHSYLFYHCQGLPGGTSYKRSVCVEEFTYNEDGSFPDDIAMTVEGPDPIAALNPYERTEAETFAWGTNVKTEVCPEGGMNVCDIINKSSLKVRNVDFGEKGPIKFHASVASEGGNDGVIEVRLDAEDGDVVGTIEVPNTGGKDKYQTCSFDIKENALTGIHDLYFVFTGKEKGEDEKEDIKLFKFDYWQFEKEPEPEPTVTPAPQQTQTPQAAVTVSPVPAPSVQPQAEKVTVAKVKSLSAKKQKGKKAKLAWKAVKDADGYEVVYATDKKLKKGVKKYSTKKTSYTVKKLKKGKKYYVKVRAYRQDSNGKKVYGSYSAVKKFKM